MSSFDIVYLNTGRLTKVLWLKRKKWESLKEW